MGEDPDDEAFAWHLIETEGGMPPGVMQALHSPKNALLMSVGLQEPAEGIARFCLERPMRYLAAPALSPRRMSDISSAIRLAGDNLSR